ncbi:MAG: GNAT family N-acetyltransferase [archaeon]|nr:GNAT family N-acetyltransferase [archaeon]
MTIAIRKARSRDAGAFLLLVRALAKFEKLEPPSPSAARRLIRDTFSKEKKLNLLLAFSDGKPIAYALYFFTYSSFLARPTLYLEDIFVLQEFRRKKIGKRIFLTLVREAKRLGCGRMEWAVLAWNKNAIKFYESVGAKRLNEWHYYRLDQRALKSLSQRQVD